MPRHAAHHHPFLTKGIATLQLVIVAVVVMAWLRPRLTHWGFAPTLPPIVPELELGHTEPVTHGPKQHPVTLPDGVGTTVTVWAHPHNNDPGFDFWSAVGPFNAQDGWDGGWEAGQFTATRRLLTAASPLPATAVVIGGWIGPMALEAASWSRTVWVFEPQPDAFAELKANVELNPVLAGRVHLSNRCIHPTPGLQPLHGSADSEARLAAVQGGVKHSSGVPHSSLPSRLVNCITWDDAVTQLGVDPDPTTPIVVNVDTEGSEWALVPSLLPWVVSRPRKPTLIIGIHGKPPSAAAHDAVLQVLQQYAVVYQGSFTPGSGRRVVQLCEFCTYYATEAAPDSVPL